MMTSALPSAAAQAAMVTACTRAALLHGDEPEHRMPIRLLSSVETVDAAGWLANGPDPLGRVLAPTTRFASGVVTELAPPGNNDGLLKFTLPNILVCSAVLLGLIS